MDATTEALTPRLTPLGLVLAVAGGATAAGVMGFVYHQVANKAGIDFIIALAVIVGAAVGLAVGVASRLGGLRAMTVVAVVAFVFGVVGYAARYFFQFNEEVETIVQEVGADAQAAGVSLDDVREAVLADLADAYPPGGFFGYMQFVAESGFSIGSRSSEGDAPIQGGLAWGLLAVEAIASGIAAVSTARNLLKSKPAPVLPAAPPSGIPPANP